MKILVLTRYSVLGASSRLRFFQYFPYLQAQGCDLTVRPLFDDAYLRRLYSRGDRSLARVAAAYAARILDLRRVREFDLIWLEKELLPWLPASVEGLLSRGLPPLVIDFDDAIFHNYDLHPSALVRLLLGSRVAASIRRARRVVAGNSYLAGLAVAAGARQVDIIPTVVDASRYADSASRPNDGEFRIGWIGSPATSRYLEMVYPAIGELARTMAVRLVAVGAGPLPQADFPVDVLPWSEATEAESIAGFDVGIMPLPDAPWERGKCGYKLIQYMAASRPVVASPVGVNVSIVGENGACGMLAGSDTQWLVALRALSQDGSLRSRLGAIGREKVVRQYSLQANAPVVWTLLKEASTG